MIKRFIFFIILIISCSFTLFSFAEILPLKKPIQTKKEKENILLIDTLKPLPKPSVEKLTKKVEKPAEKIINQGINRC